jgi:DNA-binding MarR family transcriptional regulator
VASSTAPPRARKSPAAGGAKDQTASRVLRRFRIVFNAIKAHFRTVEKATGIAGAQAWALSVVREQPGIGVVALARAMDIHQSTASNLLKPLVEQGFVATTRGDADRRSVELRLTPQGQRVLRKVPGPFEGVLPQTLGQLDHATLKRLDHDLDALIALLPAGVPRSNLPLGQPVDAAAPAPRRRTAQAPATPSRGQRGRTSKA